MSGDAEEVERKEVAEEKDSTVKGVELGKEAQLEKDITEAMVVVDEIKKEGKIISVSQRLESIIDNEQERSK